MSEHIGARQDATDIAALSASVMAVAVSIFVTPGVYTLVDLVVSITLASLLFGYLWPHERTITQSIAVACVFGFAMLPAFGFFVEVYSAREIAEVYSTAETDAVSSVEEKRSRVKDSTLAVAWLCTIIIALVGDRAFKSNGTRPR